MKLLVHQNIACEGLGVFQEALEDLGVRIRTVLSNQLTLDVTSATDDESADGLVVLGGPMNVDQTSEYPFLTVEVQTIRHFVQTGRPVLGVCLGAQLLAKALGARVYPAGVREIGPGSVRLTSEGRKDLLFSDLPDPLPVFQWHGDTFDLPEGGVLLAEGDRCRNQAFRYGERAWGLQFHLEATLEMVDEWAQAYPSEVAEEGLDARSLAGEASKAWHERRKLARTLMERFVEVMQKARGVRTDPLEA